MRKIYNKNVSTGFLVNRYLYSTTDLKAECENLVKKLTYIALGQRENYLKFLHPSTTNDTERVFT